MQNYAGKRLVLLERKLIYEREQSMNKKDMTKEKQLRATVFAEALKATDPEDMEACRKDMEKLAALDPQTAKVVAAAIRAKQMPNLIKSAGLEGMFDKIMSPHGEEHNAVGFAKKKEAPEEPEFEEEEVEEKTFPPKAEEEFEGESEGTDDFGASEDEGGDDLGFSKSNDEPSDDSFGATDESETIENDEEMKTITIEVPASKVDSVLDVLYSQLPELIGADEEMGGEEEVPVKEESFDSAPAFAKEPEMSETPEVAEGEMTEHEPQFEPRSEKMEEKELIAQRKAYRANLLERVAENRSEDIKPKDIGLGKDTSANGKPFQYSEKLQGNEGETEYPKMTLENSDGNSLKGDPGYSKIPIPTKNGDTLQLKDDYENFTFSGGDDGSLGFTVDFNELLKVPSAGETATDEKFEIPTQLNLPKQKTTVAKVVTCQGCDNPRLAEVEVVECTDCGKTLRLCMECQEDGYCPNCSADGEKCSCDDKKEAAVEIPEAEVKEDNLEVVSKKEAEVYKARIKTAYAVANQLALAKIIEADEVEDQVNFWMNDNVSVANMKKQASLMLRMVKTSAEKVAAAATEKQSTRTASVAINPTFVSGTKNNQTPINELQEAISSFFMEDYNNYKANS